MKKLSIRAKITMWFSVLIVLIVGMMFSLMLVINHHVLYTDIKKTLTQVVDANADEIEYMPDIVDEEIEAGDHYILYNDGYLEIDDDFLSESKGVYTMIMDKDGTPIYGEQAAAVHLNRSGRIQSQNIDGEKYYVYSRILSEGELEGLIVQGMANEDANKTLLTSMVGLSLLLLPILAILAIIGGYLLAGKLLHPIRQIASAAESINDGADLSRRIELGGGKDELHQLAHSFNKMFVRLERSFENEKQFISDISHELRTPVSVILAQTEVSLEKERTNEEYKSALQLVQRQGTHMKHLVNEMLQYSRLERMDTLPEPEEVDLSGLAEMVAEEQILNGEKGITLEYEVAPDICIRGNVELLIRMFNNLISNAYRYGREGGHILVRLHEDNEAVYLGVKDDGVGVDAADHDKIFHRFYQADKARSVSRESLGLGLAMVAEIARLHNAGVRVESSLGAGSEFIVTFQKTVPEKNG